MSDCHGDVFGGGGLPLAHDDYVAFVSCSRITVKSPLNKQTNKQSKSDHQHQDGYNQTYTKCFYLFSV